LIPPEACILDLGAGHGHFINHIRAPVGSPWTGGGCGSTSPRGDAHVSEVTDLSAIPDRSVDFVFASNLFEHLTQSDGALVLGAAQEKLKPGGSVNLLQPNLRFACRSARLTRLVYRPEPLGPLRQRLSRR
jgi:hypothetical protein